MFTIHFFVATITANYKDGNTHNGNRDNDDDNDIIENNKHTD